MSKNKCSTIIMSRVTGFYSHFHAFNPGKQEEFLERKKFDNSLKEFHEPNKPTTDRGADRRTSGAV